MAGYDPQIMSCETDLTEWNRFVDISPQGCIFCRSWWLDAVCPGRYDVLVLRKGDRIVAGIPLPRRSTPLGEMIGMPPLTQTLGVLVEPPESGNYEKKLSKEMSILKELVAGIPRVARFSTHCHYSLTNWLPFHWAGYQQTTRYTYVLENLNDLESVLRGFSHMKRKNIRRAEKQVTVREDMGCSEFYDHHAMTLDKQGDRISYPRDVFERIYAASHARNACKTWYAVGSDESVHSAILVVYDMKSAYYLISSIDPDFRANGSASLLLKRAITDSSQYTNRFDFEGSMIEGVEQSFRKFGARQMPYLRITSDTWTDPVRQFLSSFTSNLARWIKG